MEKWVSSCQTDNCYTRKDELSPAVIKLKRFCTFYDLKNDELLIGNKSLEDDKCCFPFSSLSAFLFNRKHSNFLYIDTPLY